jgi:hypothetical protein
MAGTRTAPLFTAAANERQISLALIDASGDLWSEMMPVPVAATAATIEAWAAAYAAGSNSSLYSIFDMQGRTSVGDADNAVAAFRSGKENGINFGFRNVTTLTSYAARLISPIDAVMQGNQDIPLVTAAEATALIAAIIAIKTGFALQTAQFTGRKEAKNNPRIKV